MLKMGCYNTTHARMLASWIIHIGGKCFKWELVDKLYIYNIHVNNSALAALADLSYVLVAVIGKEDTCSVRNNLYPCSVVPSLALERWVWFPVYSKLQGLALCQQSQIWTGNAIG